ncbi:MAG: BrnT family toxin [Acidobacteria bacterium]|nr:BrnT family toxin [Acidobacteriota bacterium]
MKEGIEFEWDAANAAHIARHGITPREAEQAMVNDPVEVRSAVRGAEFRTLRLGQTDAGRYLTLIYTRRGGQIRIVTAYPMKRKHRRLYEGHKGKA